MRIQHRHQRVPTQLPIEQRWLLCGVPGRRSRIGSDRVFLRLFLDIRFAVIRTRSRNRRGLRHRRGRRLRHWLGGRYWLLRLGCSGRRAHCWTAGHNVIRRINTGSRRCRHRCTASIGNLGRARRCNGTAGHRVTTAAITPTAARGQQKQDCCQTEVFTDPV